MTKEELMKLAEAVRDGKATEQEKLQFLKTLNSELSEVSEAIKAVKKEK